MGRMAGPESPPVTLPSRGRPASTSIAMPRTVLITASASAPAASASRAIPAMSGTLGESFTISVLSVVARAKLLADVRVVVDRKTGDAADHRTRPRCELRDLALQVPIDPRILQPD